MYLFHHKDRSILFPDLCSTRDGDFWERILSLNAHVFHFFMYSFIHPFLYTRWCCGGSPGELLGGG